MLPKKTLIAMRQRIAAFRRRTGKSWRTAAVIVADEMGVNIEGVALATQMRGLFGKQPGRTMRQHLCQVA